MLRSGPGGASGVPVALRLLRDCGGLQGIAARSARELHGPGLGPARAASLVAAFGLARRLCEEEFRPGRLLHDAREVAGWVRAAARGARRERFYAVLLDARSCVIGLRVISTGIVDAAPVHPREVFGPAVREAASAVVLAHNHPSGDPSPSEQDRAATERLRRAGELLGIEVLDHVVVGSDRYFSFADDATRPYGAAASAVGAGARG